MSLPAPEQTLLNDGESLAINALKALKTGIDSWLTGTATAVPKITTDLVPAVTGFIENLAPASAKPYLQTLFDLFDVAAGAVLDPIDAVAISGIKLAQSNVNAAIEHFVTMI